MMKNIAQFIYDESSDYCSYQYLASKKELPFISDIINKNLIFMHTGIYGGKYLPFEIVKVNEIIHNLQTYYIYVLTIDATNCNYLDYKEKNFDKIDNTILLLLINYLRNILEGSQDRIMWFATWNLNKFISEESNLFGKNFKKINVSNDDCLYTLVSIYPNEENYAYEFYHLY